MKEDEGPAGEAQAESREEGVLELGQSVVSSAKEYLARSEALLSAETPVKNTGGGGNRDGEVREDHQA